MAAQNPNPPESADVTPSPVTIVREPLRVLFTWQAPVRPFKKQSREVYTTGGSIAFLVCVILLFIKEFLLIMVIIAGCFLYYILSTVKPEEVEHEITNRGIKTLNKSYPWEVLGRFWFEGFLMYISNSR